jgi:hypothetical protein
VHRDEDLLGGVLVLDERDEAQRRLALLTGDDREKARVSDLGVCGGIFVQIPDFVRVGARGRSR